MTKASLKSWLTLAQIGTLFKKTFTETLEFESQANEKVVRLNTRSFDTKFIQCKMGRQKIWRDFVH